MKLRRGFTIIEILVVIGIIAVLTVIVFPSINNIRAKNRDTERVADIATIQLGLSLFYNQTGSYPTTLSDPNLVPKYFPADAIIGPTSANEYIYVPLSRGSGTKCTYYHLGTLLELPSAQIDTASTFSSKSGAISNGYSYCTYQGSSYSGSGIGNYTDSPLMYSVHP
jgi:general secretion pathway protein G